MIIFLILEEWKNYFGSCTLAEKPEALKLLSMILKDHDFSYYQSPGQSSLLNMGSLPWMLLNKYVFYQLIHVSKLIHFKTSNNVHQKGASPKNCNGQSTFFTSQVAYIFTSFRFRIFSKSSAPKSFLYLPSCTLYLPIP